MRQSDKSAASPAEKAIDQAVFLLSLWEQEHDRAFQLLCGAESAWNSKALLWLGRCWFWGWGTAVDRRGAVRYWKAAAEQGSADALVEFEQFYGKGLGIDGEITCAFEDFERRAETGDATAQFNAGYCCLRRLGVARNVERAFYWCQKSADQGNTHGMYGLGECYSFENGPQPDCERGFELFKKAADLKNVHAIRALAHCYSAGIGVA